MMFSITYLDRWGDAVDLRQLNAFITIARTLNFTRAADLLDYAQSTVTTQIRMLEDELGIKLFERLGRNITLSDAGQRLLPYASQILKLSQEAKNAVSDPAKPSGALVIGTAESLCITRLPALLKKYRMRCPDVEIILRFGRSQDFQEGLKENSLDVAFFINRKVPMEDFIIAAEFPEPVILLVSPDHPLAESIDVNPEDLADQTLILTEMGCPYRAAFENIMYRHKVRPHSIMESASVQAIKQLAVSGLGVALLPKAAVEEDLDLNRLKALNWRGSTVEVVAQLIYHKDKWLSPPLSAFLSLFHEHFAKQAS